MTPLLVAAGAAVGAPLRFWLGERLDADTFPWGVWLANVTGSFVLGLLTALAVTGHPSALLGTGFCGGFTTYSTFAVQAHDSGPRRGTTYAVATVAASLLACTLGYLVA